MKTLAILPRGGLGDVLYHALFARYGQSNFPDLNPVLLAPRYAAFLCELLAVRHLPVCSFVTDSTAGLHIGGELEFFRALYNLRGACLASFTNDVIDHGLARLFRLSSFDGGALGNSTVELNDSSGPLSRARLNRFFAQRDGSKVNPKHIVCRQQQALLHFGRTAGHLLLPKAYREIWLDAIGVMGATEIDSRLVLLFPETARTERNLTFEQVDAIAGRLHSDYEIRIFTRDPEIYRSLGVETVGFTNRLEPLRQIRRAAAVITADTFSAHLAGLCGTPTYVIYNFAYRPIWCEYWGAPFDNVFNFEGGICYHLDEDFRAFPCREDSVLFDAAWRASELTGKLAYKSQSSRVLSGSAARS